jgi:uncharacterized protein
MQKDFLPYDVVRNNALKLACEIHRSGFVPDIIYVLLRGGAYIGNVISEYFKIIRRNDRPVFYAAVVARSYLDIRQHDRVMVDGWTYGPEYLRNGDRVLLVDDIFDSGRTINHLAEIILEKGIPRDDLKIAVHDYKVFPDGSNLLPVKPDFYCRRHEITSPDKDVWIHYMSHELVGLKADEIVLNYPNIDAETREILIQAGK